MLLRITSVLMAILGVALVYTGGTLLAVGGTPAYGLIGVAMLITAVLLWRRKRSALSLYAVLMWAILAWIIAEVGLDKWQWIPRGDIFALLGLWLATPWVVRRLSAPQPPAARPNFHPLLGATVALMALLVTGLMFYDPYPQPGRIDNPALASGAGEGSEGAGADWTAYGGSNAGQRFSRLGQIDSGNVHKLKLAWEYHTGDLRDPDKDAGEYTFEATPLKVNNQLYLCTAHNEVHALDPQTGRLNWKYTPEKIRSYLQQHQTCRGVSYYANPDAQAPAAQCSKRIISATADARLIALDADSGTPCADFGNHGSVDLSANMGKIRPHALMQTAAPLVAGNLIILGSSVMDNGYNSGNPSGVIRAYDVISGKLLWNFDPADPQHTTPLAAGQSYAHDTPVAWATLSADMDSGLVFVPFGNASPDELGRQRDPASTAEKFRDTLVALDLHSGAFKWQFQTSYNDLWDRDNPSQPSLLDLGEEDHKQLAVVLPTKTGNIFVLNRLTGEPIIPVDQVRVDSQGGVAGEHFAASQPVSRLNFIPEPLKESSMWGLTPFDQLACRISFRKLQYNGTPWTPSRESGSLVFPGNIGVFNWGSVAVDPQRQILVATPVRLAYRYTLFKRTPEQARQRLFTEEGKPYWNENFDGDYAVRIKQFASALDIPCIAPPWGRMVGIDLRTGKSAWMRRIGTTKNLKTGFWPGGFPLGLPVGMVAHGGPLITAGGVIFHGSTADNFFRAYDVNSGELLWQTELPAGGQATPSTYLGQDGQQYVVIAAGGHGAMGVKLGDSVMAFRLE